MITGTLQAAFEDGYDDGRAEREPACEDYAVGEVRDAYLRGFARGYNHAADAADWAQNDMRAALREGR